MTPVDISKNDRRKARVLALQVLYSREQNSDSSLNELFKGITEIEEVQATRPGIKKFARELVQKALDDKNEIDALVGKHTKNWEVERLASIDRNLLRLAVAELTGDFGTPLRVVINEIVEIAKIYGTDDSAKFVNGVIDAVKNEINYTE